ncbi:MAG: Acid phosphatase [Chlamydiae bacterium]|nr:Acid phosphatase [Chlamydiota bacterium]
MNAQQFKNKIYLIRHGETEWSRSKQHTGRTDLPLTKEGERQAKTLKRALAGIDFKKVFVSPLKRALQTCEFAGFLNQSQQTDDLYEWDYGDCEGLTTQQIRERTPNWNLFKDGAPNGESIEQVAARADQIIQLASQIEGNVALFSSGHISRVIGARWLSLEPQKAQLLALSTASISILGYEHEWKVIQNWNITSHTL